MDKLKVGDIIEVIGWVMMKKLEAGGKYKVSRMGTSFKRRVYFFTKPNGKKEIVEHYVSDVDMWINTENNNRIEILSKENENDKKAGNKMLENTESEIVEVEYISIWDGDEIETKAKYNKITKEVFDIVKVEIDEDYNTCDEQFIRIDDFEFKVVEIGDKYYTEAKI